MWQREKSRHGCHKMLKNTDRKNSANLYCGAFIYWRMLCCMFSYAMHGNRSNLRHLTESQVHPLSILLVAWRWSQFQLTMGRAGQIPSHLVKWFPIHPGEFTRLTCCWCEWKLKKSLKSNTYCVFHRYPSNNCRDGDQSWRKWWTDWQADISMHIAPALTWQYTKPSEKHHLLQAFLLFCPYVPRHWWARWKEQTWLLPRQSAHLLHHSRPNKHNQCLTVLSMLPLWTRQLTAGLLLNACLRCWSCISMNQSLTNCSHMWA